jgi:acylphosphatase
MSDVICKHFVVTGKVQGVWYRKHTQQKAKKFGLVGWVRNGDDGSVELVASGKPDALAKLEKWLWRGPLLARVNSVEANAQAAACFADFSIKNLDS